MRTDSRYFQQVRLLVEVLPAVAAEDCFALKGGTAINLFLHDLPRLSVDIDLTYLPIRPAAEAHFGFARMPVLAHDDLYAGKLMAALDRQHPRDLFDVMVLFAGAGITDALFRPWCVWRCSMPTGCRNRMRSRIQR